MSPGSPLAGEVVPQHVRQRQSVVCIYLTVLVEQLVQVLVQFVAPSAFELLKHLRGPVGGIDLIRVVEEAVWPLGIGSFELAVEVFQVVGNCRGTEVVYHVATTAWRRALHLHHAILVVGCYHLPVALGCRPFQAFTIYQSCQVGDAALVAALGKSHHALQRTVRRVECQRFLRVAVTGHIEGFCHQFTG